MGALVRPTSGSRQASTQGSGSPLRWPALSSGSLSRTTQSIPATSTTSTGTTFPQQTLMATSTRSTKTGTGGRTARPTVEAAAMEPTLTGTGAFTGERPESALTLAPRSTAAALPLTSLSLRTSATLSPLSTLFLSLDTPSTPTLSCGSGPTATITVPTLRIIRRCNSWPSTQATLSSRFMEPSSIQSTPPIFTQLLEPLTTGTNPLE